MSSKETFRLLRDYIDTRSEESFRELVRRYIDLVYSCALRIVNGDVHLAEDVSQTVFTDLAQGSFAFAGQACANKKAGPEGELDEAKIERYRVK